MTAFTDFISDLPIAALSKAAITSKRVVIPAEISKDDLYDSCKETINQPGLPPEKALYLFLLSKAT
jgi:hypothetical protein